MRVAVYDNLANNGVNHVRGLRRVGVDAHVVPDPRDEFAMSDPRWEEIDVELPSDRLVRSNLPPVKLPEWVRLPDSPPPGGRAGVLRALQQTPVAVARAARAAGRPGVSFAGERGWLLATLREYDCVLGFGLGPALAALAGVPCVADTWGGDIMLIPFYDDDPGATPSQVALARLQRFGLARASRVLLAEPRYRTAARRLGLDHKAEFLPLVVDGKRYSPGTDPEVRGSLVSDEDELLVFMPARQDWRWKGSDRFLRGFAELPVETRRNVRVVCSGWGEDVQRSRRLSAELRIDDRVRFLPYALSKGRLIRFLRAADIVVDQFVLHSLGGSALEAMSCGCPLVTSIDPDAFRREFGEVPPVAACSEPEEIAHELARLIDDTERRRVLGAQGREYVQRHHGDAVSRRSAELLQAAAGLARNRSRDRGNRPGGG